jgi:hypothetical protein
MSELCTILLVQSRSGCFVGGLCQFYSKSIGITLDDLLRDEIRSNTTMNNQSSLVKMSAALTMIIFVGGLINSILSLLTFQNKELRKVGCGMYLLASSITSLLTICMFTVKFWFVVLTQMNISTSLSVLRGGCVSIEPILKLFVYVDSWLNACVAIERAVNVNKGIHFDREKSKRIARWIIIILPFCVMVSIIHEPLYRKLFVYNTEKVNIIRNETKEAQMYKNEVYGNETYGNVTYENKAESYVWCMTHYSDSVQNYNTVILFFHLVAPFVVNFFSALIIIFRAARQRSTLQTRQTYREHVLQQLSEHKQLIISPIILLVLTLPRLIISLLSGCVKVSNNPWLYLLGYFISFTPSMLVFVVFVVPSTMYRKTFKESFQYCRRNANQ